MTVLNPIIEFLIRSQLVNASPIFSVELFNIHADEDDHVLCQNLNWTFLILLAGEHHPEYSQAQAFLNKLVASREWEDWARFYLTGTQLIASELEQCCRQDPELKATFKIDLDQVFPQTELIEQTGASAFEHFQTPLWGATGLDAEGQPIELGMIARAETGKQIGDYLRLLTFSAYAEALPADISEIKNITDPFTACFISRLSITVALLRFFVKA
jgi:hypothetical protein